MDQGRVAGEPMLLPRFHDAPRCLGIERNRFNAEIWPLGASRLIEAAENVYKRRPNTVLHISHTNLTQSASPTKTAQEGRV